MREPCRDLDLADKPLGAERRGEFRPQDFHRHLAMVLQILGKVDRGHPARADLFLDGVAVGEGGFETVEEIWHWRFGSAGDSPRIHVRVLDGQARRGRAWLWLAFVFVIRVFGRRMVLLSGLLFLTPLLEANR